MKVVECFVNTAFRANNFIVGLTDVSPLISTTTLWNYTVCGQYAGEVPAGTTVPVYCPYNIPKFSYLIVQFPLNNASMTVCEVEVIAPGKWQLRMNGEYVQ